ncbi:Lrp/AsnC family transcriptional regulator [Propionibacterium freudenreichii]|uniref:Lrp/AsnC family transcriptional regulator n=1 Tax=Propionibacterium freudenreichii TaxID=1744 RepID=UPI0005421506|nr:Lrp/AsnC family transcriptional regulator [Propionibacterium freudenreichii]CEG98598.1 AsnC-family transcriptional regulatory protein [Propionibacterium freudenreichii]
MESTDQHILALLSREGRMSFTEIGRETGLSTSAAQQRVRRLEQRGIITGYHARIDGAALGHTLAAFIEIRPLGQVDESLVDVLASMPEIVSCYSVAGDASHLCLAEVTSTQELDDLLTRIRTAVNVSTSTTVVLRTLFRDRPPIDDPAVPAAKR